MVGKSWAGALEGEERSIHALSGRMAGLTTACLHDCPALIMVVGMGNVAGNKWCLVRHERCTLNHCSRASDADENGNLLVGEEHVETV